MRKRCPFLFMSAVICCAATSTALAAAQTTTQSPTPATQPQIPVIHANTRAVVVDVVVSKGQDEPVTALRKRDFELLEDGKPQSIDFFEEHTVPVLNAAQPDIKLTPMPPNVYTNVPAAPATDSVNVLLFDQLNTPHQDQSYVREQVLNYLRQAKPDARIAIFILGSRLNLIQGFTDDPTALRAALDDKQTGFNPGTTNVSRTHQDDEADRAEVGAIQKNLGGRGRSTAGIAALSQSQRDYAQFEADQRISMTLDALQSLGRYLAGIPGRKNLIWFSGQYPIYFFPHTGEKQSFDYPRQHTSEIKQTSDILTLSRVSVYPMDATGMMMNYKEDTEHPGKPTMSDYTQMSAERSDKMSAMEQIASDTGGKAFFNTNDLNSAVNHVIHTGAHFYTLIYTPPNNPMDGQFHHIQIKLNQGKYTLAYRRGYYATEESRPDSTTKRADSTPTKASGAQSASQQGSDPLSSLMDRGKPSATQLLYAVRILPVTQQPGATAKPAGLNTKVSKPTTRYAADFFIDWKKVQLQSAPDGRHTGLLRIKLIAWDHDGKALNWTSQTMGLAFDPPSWASIQKSGIPAHLELDLPEREVYLSTGICDLLANKAGTLEIPINASPATAAKVQP